MPNDKFTIDLEINPIVSPQAIKNLAAQLQQAMEKLQITPKTGASSSGRPPTGAPVSPAESATLKSLIASISSLVQAMAKLETSLKTSPGGARTASTGPAPSSGAGGTSGSKAAGENSVAAVQKKVEEGGRAAAEGVGSVSTDGVSSTAKKTGEVITTSVRELLHAAGATARSSLSTASLQSLHTIPTLEGLRNDLREISSGKGSKAIATSFEQVKQLINKLPEGARTGTEPLRVALETLVVNLGNLGQAPAAKLNDTFSEIRAALGKLSPGARGKLIGSVQQFQEEALSSIYIKLTDELTAAQAQLKAASKTKGGDTAGALQNILRLVEQITDVGAFAQSPKNRQVSPLQRSPGFSLPGTELFTEKGGLADLRAQAGPVANQIQKIVTNFKDMPSFSERTAAALKVVKDLLGTSGVSADHVLRSLQGTTELLKFSTQTKLIDAREVQVVRKEVERIVSQLEKATIARGRGGVAGLPSKVDVSTFPGATAAQKTQAAVDSVRQSIANATDAARGFQRAIVFDNTPVGSISVAFKKLGGSVDSVTSSATQMNRQFTARQGLATAFRRVTLWGTAASLAFGAVNVFRDAVKSMISAETGVIALVKVVRDADVDLEKFKQTALSFAKTIAVDFGASIEQALDSMRIFAQQGLAFAEVQSLTRAATLSANVSTLNQTQAAEALTAATRQFNIEASDAIRIVDSWNEVANRNAVTETQLTDALKKAGSAAKAVGVEFDQLNGLVAAVGTATRQPGKEIGTSLRFIFQRTLRPETEKALSKVGVATKDLSGNFRGFITIINDLSTRWNSLNKSQQLNTAQALGGARQYNVFLALMKNFDIAVKATSDSINSQGSAADENRKVMNTTAKIVAKLKASLEATAISFGKVMLPAINATAGALRGVLEGFEAIPGVLKGGIAVFGIAALAATKLGRALDILSVSSSIGGGGGIAAAGSGIVGGLIGRGKGAEQIGEITKRINLTPLQRQFKSLGDLSKGTGANLLIAGRGIEIAGKSASTSAANFSKFQLAVRRARITDIATGATLGTAGFTGLNSILSKTALLFARFGQVTAKAFVHLTTTLPIAAGYFFNVSKASRVAAKSFLVARAASLGLGASLAVLGAASLGIYALIKVTGLFASTVVQTGKLIEVDEKKTLARREKLLRQLTQQRSLFEQITSRSKGLAAAERKVAEGGGSPTAADRNLLERTKQAKLERTVAASVVGISPELISGFDEFGTAVLKTGTSLQVLTQSAVETQSSLVALSKVRIAEGFANDALRAEKNLNKLLKRVKELTPSVEAEVNLFGRVSRFSKQWSDATRKVAESQSKLSQAVKLVRKQIEGLPSDTPVDAFSKFTQNTAIVKAFAFEAGKLNKVFRQIGNEATSAGELINQSFIKARGGTGVQETGQLTRATLRDRGVKEFALTQFKQVSTAGKQVFRSGQIAIFGEKERDVFGVSQATVRVRRDGLVLVEALKGLKGPLSLTINELRNRVGQDSLKNIQIFDPKILEQQAKASILRARKVIAGAGAGIIKLPGQLELGVKFNFQLGDLDRLQKLGSRASSLLIEAFKAQQSYNKALETSKKTIKDTGGQASILTAELSNLTSKRLFAGALTQIISFSSEVEKIANGFEKLADKLRTANIKDIVEEQFSDLFGATRGLARGLAIKIPSQEVTAEQKVTQLSPALARGIRAGDRTLEAVKNAIVSSTKLSNDLPKIFEQFTQQDQKVFQSSFKSLKGDFKGALQLTALTSLTNVNRQGFKNIITALIGAQKEDKVETISSRERLLRANAAFQNQLRGLLNNIREGRGPTNTGSKAIESAVGKALGVGSFKIDVPGFGNILSEIVKRTTPGGSASVGSRDVDKLLVSVVTQLVAYQKLSTKNTEKFFKKGETEGNLVSAFFGLVQGVVKKLGGKTEASDFVGGVSKFFKSKVFGGKDFESSKKQQEDAGQALKFLTENADKVRPAFRKLLDEAVKSATAQEANVVSLKKVVSNNQSNVASFAAVAKARDASVDSLNKSRKSLLALGRAAQSAKEQLGLIAFVSRAFTSLHLTLQKGVRGIATAFDSFDALATLRSPVSGAAAGVFAPKINLGQAQNELDPFTRVVKQFGSAVTPVIKAEQARISALKLFESTNKQFLESQNKINDLVKQDIPNRKSLLEINQSTYDLQSRFRDVLLGTRNQMSPLIESFRQLTGLEAAKKGIEGIITELRKAESLEFDTTSIDKALGKSPFSPTKGVFGQPAGLDQFQRREFVLDQKVKQPGGLTRDELAQVSVQKKKIEFDKEEARIQVLQQKENQKLQREVQGAQKALDILFTAQTKGIGGLQPIIASLKSELESAGDVNVGFRGEKEFQGVPGLESIIPDLTKVQDKLQRKGFGVQREVLIGPLEELTKTSNSLLEKIKEEISKANAAVTKGKDPADFFDGIATKVSALLTKSASTLSESNADTAQSLIEFVSGSSGAFAKLTEQVNFTTEGFVAFKAQLGTIASREVSPTAVETSAKETLTKQSGGFISQGIRNKDSVPAVLAGGEFVIREPSVRKFGKGFFDKLNSGRLPQGFAEGGLVDSKSFFGTRPETKEERESRLKDIRTHVQVPVDGKKINAEAESSRLGGTGFLRGPDGTVYYLAPRPPPKEPSIQNKFEKLRDLAIRIREGQSKVTPAQFKGLAGSIGKIDFKGIKKDDLNTLFRFQDGDLSLTASESRIKKEGRARQVEIDKKEEANKGVRESIRRSFFSTVKSDVFAASAFRANLSGDTADLNETAQRYSFNLSRRRADAFARLEALGGTIDFGSIKSAQIFRLGVPEVLRGLVSSKLKLDKDGDYIGQPTIPVTLPGEGNIQGTGRTAQARLSLVTVNGDKYIRFTIPGQKNPKTGQVGPPIVQEFPAESFLSAKGKDSKGRPTASIGTLQNRFLELTGGKETRGTKGANLPSIRGIGSKGNVIFGEESASSVDVDALKASRPTWFDKYIVGSIKTAISTFATAASTAPGQGKNSAFELVSRIRKNKKGVFSLAPREKTTAEMFGEQVGGMLTYPLQAVGNIGAAGYRGFRSGDGFADSVLGGIKGIGRQTGAEATGLIKGIAETPEHIAGIVDDIVHNPLKGIKRAGAFAGTLAVGWLAGGARNPITGVGKAATGIGKAAAGVGRNIVKLAKNPLKSVKGFASGVSQKARGFAGGVGNLFKPKNTAEFQLSQGRRAGFQSSQRGGGLDLNKLDPNKIGLDRSGKTSTSTALDPSLIDVSKRGTLGAPPSKAVLSQTASGAVAPTGATAGLLPRSSAAVPSTGTTATVSGPRPITTKGVLGSFAAGAAPASVYGPTLTSLLGIGASGSIAAIGLTGLGGAAGVLLYTAIKKAGGIGKFLKGIKGKAAGLFSGRSIKSLLNRGEASGVSGTVSGVSGRVSGKATPISRPASRTAAGSFETPTLDVRTRFFNEELAKLQPSGRLTAPPPSPTIGLQPPPTSGPPSAGFLLGQRRLPAGEFQSRALSQGPFPRAAAPGERLRTAKGKFAPEGKVQPIGPKVIKKGKVQAGKVDFETLSQLKDIRSRGEQFQALRRDAARSKLRQFTGQRPALAPLTKAARSRRAVDRAQRAEANLKRLELLDPEQAAILRESSRNIGLIETGPRNVRSGELKSLRNKLIQQKLSRDAGIPIRTAGIDRTLKGHLGPGPRPPASARRNKDHAAAQAAKRELEQARFSESQLLARSEGGVPFNLPENKAVRRRHRVENFGETHVAAIEEVLRKRRQPARRLPGFPAAGRVRSGASDKSVRAKPAPGAAAKLNAELAKRRLLESGVDTSGPTPPVGAPAGAGKLLGVSPLLVAGASGTLGPLGVLGAGAIGLGLLYPHIRQFIKFIKARKAKKAASAAKVSDASRLTRVLSDGRIPGKAKATFIRDLELGTPVDRLVSRADRLIAAQRIDAPTQLRSKVEALKGVPLKKIFEGSPFVAKKLKADVQNTIGLLDKSRGLGLAGITKPKFEFGKKISVAPRGAPPPGPAIRGTRPPIARRPATSSQLPGGISPEEVILRGTPKRQILYPLQPLDRSIINIHKQKNLPLPAGPARSIRPPFSPPPPGPPAPGPRISSGPPPISFLNFKERVQAALSSKGKIKTAASLLDEIQAQKGTILSGSKLKPVGKLQVKALKTLFEGKPSIGIHSRTKKALNERGLLSGENELTRLGLLEASRILLRDRLPFSAARKKAGLKGVSKFAVGGVVKGPGGPTSDIIPAMLSRGEFVLPARAVNRFPGGVQMLKAISSGNAKGFAKGGLVGFPGSGEEEIVSPLAAAAARVEAVLDKLATSVNATSSSVLNSSTSRGVVTSRSPGSGEEASGTGTKIDIEAIAAAISAAIADAIKANPVQLAPDTQVTLKIPEQDELPTLKIDEANLPAVTISEDSQAALSSAISNSITTAAGSLTEAITGALQAAGKTSGLGSAIRPKVEVLEGSVAILKEETTGLTLDIAELKANAGSGEGVKDLIASSQSTILDTINVSNGLLQTELNERFNDVAIKSEVLSSISNTEAVLGSRIDIIDARISQALSLAHSALSKGPVT